MRNTEYGMKSETEFLHSRAIALVRIPYSESDAFRISSCVRLAGKLGRVGSPVVAACDP
jgi:hypothetical protein